jgi:hypothetical protein
MYGIEVLPLLYVAVDGQELGLLTDGDRNWHHAPATRSSVLGKCSSAPLRTDEAVLCERSTDGDCPFLSCAKMQRESTNDVEITNKMMLDKRPDRLFL